MHDLAATITLLESSTCICRTDGVNPRSHLPSALLITSDNVSVSNHDLYISYLSSVLPACRIRIMTLPFFAGRSTLRRLHQTAQRNIFQRHSLRRESSKPPPTPESASYLSPRQWAFIDPLLIPFRGYGNMQKRRPLLTQFESTLVIYFLGDLSAQTVGSSAYTTASYEPVRGLRALIIAATISIPSYKYFLFLGRHFNYSSHLVSLAVKIVVNQTFFTPLFNTYFFGMQSLLSGSSFKEAGQRVVNTVPTSWLNSWKVWPVVTAFNFTFIAPQNRSVFAGVIAIGWQTYLSWLNKQAEAKEGKDGQSEMQKLEDTVDNVIEGGQKVIDAAKA